MAELAYRDRLQPSLLDRLTDDEPDRKQEGADKRFFSPTRLRAVVRRDVAWLLNTCHLAATEDLSEYPEVERSVLNYGLPDLTGVTLSGLDVATLERIVKQAIADFEPRLLPGSVRVRASVDENRMSQNSLIFQVEAELWAQPAPESIVLQSEVDLESGLFSVRE